MTAPSRIRARDDFWDEVARRNDERFGEGRWHCDDILCEQRIGCPVQAFLAHARLVAFQAADHGTRPCYERLKSMYQNQFPHHDPRTHEDVTRQLARIAGV